jgi:hypothetical protein
MTSASLAFFVYYGQWFPPTLAVHFNGAGQPDGWMDRVKFIVVGSSMSLMVPALVAALGGVMPRVLPVSVLSLPNKAYWMAPERRELTFNRMLFASLWLGCLVQAFLLAVWIMIVRANPAGLVPHLPRSHAVVVGGFVVAVLGFVVWMSRTFARPR